MYDYLDSLVSTGIICLGLEAALSFIRTAPASGSSGGGPPWLLI